MTNLSSWFYRSTALLLLLLSLPLNLLHAQSPANSKAFITIPTLTIKEVSSTTAKVYFNKTEASDKFQIRFRETGTANWSVTDAGTMEYFELRLLKPNTNYELQGRRNENENSPWSPLSGFQTKLTPTGPNILVIVLDDSRYDPFGAASGGQPFMATPAIDRIGNEGVNFTYCFPALSLCGPSRASIVSGLYPHHHKLYDNSFIDTLPYITVAQILHDNGYYTGWVGKYGFEKFPIPGYDYWLQSSSDQYFNASYQYNGVNVVYAQHKTDVLTGKALEFLNSVPSGDKFMLFLDHKAPHVPYDPRPQDAGIFDNDPMPIPTNFYHWQNNYPSHYYECNNGESDTPSLNDNLRGYYELLNGAEWSIDTIMQYLDDHNLTDSTMIIFTSDNGLLKSEHFLSGKEVALDPSLRLPMFIRYPKWFPAGAHVDSEMVMNIDIAPTMLDAAGIPDTFGMDGVSMKAIYDQSIHRKELFYEFFNRFDECNPTITAIRDFKYKYINNECASEADEFYDLVLDSNENTNLINNQAYAALIDEYRLKLNVLKQQYDYINIRDTVVDCTLMEPDSSIGVGIPTLSNFQPGELRVFPNPVHDNLNVHINMPSVSLITIQNTMGQVIYRNKNESVDGEILEKINVNAYPPGAYLLQVWANDRRASLPFVKY